MSDKTYIPDGKYPELRIVLSKERDEGQKPKRFSNRDRLGSSNIPVYVPDDDPLPENAPRGLSVYDLTTRMRSVDPETVSGLEYRPHNSLDVPEQHDDFVTEFVEVEFERLGTLSTPQGAPPADPITLTDDDYTWLNNALLGSREPILPGHESDPRDALDPFSFAPINGSGRMIPVCMEISHLILGVHETDEGDPESFPFNFKKGQVNGFWMTPANKAVHLNPEGVGLGSIVYYDVDESVKPVIWKGYDPDLELEINPAERWSTKAIDLGLDIHAHAKKRVLTITSDLGIVFGNYIRDAFGNLLIDPQGAFGGGIPPQLHFGYGYEGFSTSDTDTFKITNDPWYESDVVTFKVKGQDNRVYVRPTLVGYTWSKDIDLDGGTGRDIYKAWVSRSPVYPSGSELNCYIHRSPLADYDDIPVDYRNLGLASTFSLNEGSLVAAIAQGSKIFYIWRKIPRTPDTLFMLGFNAGYQTIGDCA
jgi:hypothetical protein